MGIGCIHSWHLMNNKVGCLLHGPWHHETHQMILQYGWSCARARVSKPVLSYIELVRESYILVVQMELKDMISFRRNSSLSCQILTDSTFNTNKYGYQLYMFVVFDEQQSGVLVTWVVMSCSASQDIALWLDHLLHRCYQLRPDWKVNAFMVDDALAEIIALRYRSFFYGSSSFGTCLDG